MKIIEKYIIGKKNNLKDCEDELVITDNFIAVIDGVTSKSKFKYDDKTTGKKASEVILETIKEFVYDITSVDAVKMITRKLEEEYEKIGIYENVLENPKNRFAANAIIYSKYSNEIWSIGDCQCMMNNKVYKFEKEVDTIIADVRAFYLEGLILNGEKVHDLIKHDKSREYIKPLLEMQLSFQNEKANHQYSYCVIDGFEMDYSKIEIINVNDCEEIILASDGYPKLFDTLEKSEKHLKKIIELDPLCFKEYKSTKGIIGDNISFDDRCYIRFKLE